MTERNIKPISPFLTFCQKVIPLAFDESISYYECLCAMLKHIQEMDTAVNKNADAVTELQNYVANYFKNLDVQEEINNKLDEMVEDGTLAEIINVQIFDELNTKVNQALSDIETLDNNVGDVSQLNTTSKEVVGAINEINGDLGDVSQLDTTSKEIVGAINEVKSDVNELTDFVLDTMVIFGDSWSIEDSYYLIDPEESQWHVLVAKRLNLKRKNYAIDAAKFVPALNRHTFAEELQNAKDDETLDPNKVKYVFIMGGINDDNDTLADFKEAHLSMINATKEYFTKAEIVVIGLNQSWDFRTGTNGLLTQDLAHAIKVNTIKANVSFCDITTLMFNKKKYFNNELDPTPAHPNNLGASCLASRVVSAVTGTPYSNPSVNNNDVSEFSNATAITHEYAIENTSAKLLIQLIQHNNLISYQFYILDTNHELSANTYYTVPVSDLKLSNENLIYPLINPDDFVQTSGIKGVLRYSGKEQYNVNFVIYTVSSGLQTQPGVMMYS